MASAMHVSRVWIPGGEPCELRDVREGPAFPRDAAIAYTLCMHSAQVLDHFQNPRNAGELAGATASTESANPVCGDVLRLSVCIEEGRITAARFKAQGCVASIACGSLLTEMIVGKTSREALLITPDLLSEGLGGLPPATFHAAQLACEALRALLTSIP
jgi:nitrogen fixation NifU-like protein